jgi:hypothetical protein
MKVSLAEQGLYYRSLLVLVRKDRTIADEERRLMIAIGRSLGFEEEFCSGTIDDILDNSYIPDDPPRFSDPAIALCFLRDGVRIASADGTVDDAERAWLAGVAAVNALPPSTLESILAQIAALAPASLLQEIEATRFHWK